MKKQEK